MTIATVPATRAIAGRSYAHDAGRLMPESGIHRSQQITQLVDEAGQHRPGVGRDQFIEPWGSPPSPRP